MNEQNDPLVEFLVDKPKIWLPQDLAVQNAYQVYGPSFQTEDLLSEEGRNLYGESCKSRPETNKVDRLQHLCVEYLAREFKGGVLDERLRYDNLVLFGEKLNVDALIEDLIELEVSIAVVHCNFL